MANVAQGMTPNEETNKAGSPSLWDQLSNWWTGQSADDRAGYYGAANSVLRGIEENKAQQAANEIAVAKSKWAGFHPSWAPEAEPIPMQNLAGNFLHGMNAGKSENAKREFAQDMWEALKAKQLAEVTNKAALEKGK